MSCARSRWKMGLGALVMCAVLAYLRDPPWLAGVTSGFGHWEQNRAGVRFRWMGGRASFFVPSGAERVEIPFQALFSTEPPGPFLIDVRVDDSRVSRVIVREQGWVTATIPIPAVATSRRFRRIDLSANRTWGERSLSVQVGEIKVR
jgi:hypothetical protein